MKAITLHQPHAHLVGLGVKMFETRSWNTSFRGLLAIHAAKIQPRELECLVVDPNDDKPTYLKPYDKYLPASWNDYFGDLNHGGVEALVQLVATYEAPVANQWAKDHAVTAKTKEDRERFEHMAAFGDFSPGRWAWHLELRLVCNGNLGLVRGFPGLWTLPDDHEQKLLQAYFDLTGDMICRLCGCINDDPCVTEAGCCGWAEDFLCTACVGKEAQ